MLARYCLIYFLNEIYRETSSEERKACGAKVPSDQYAGKQMQFGVFCRVRSEAFSQKENQYFCFQDVIPPPPPFALHIPFAFSFFPVS